MARLFMVLSVCLSLFCLSHAVISEEKAEKLVQVVKKMAQRTGGYDGDVGEEFYERVEGTQPTVQTTSGMLYGLKTGDDNSFYGIRYAQPPNGTLRFLPPVSLSTPTVSRNASVRSVIRCPQFNANCTEEACEQEDCLVLNVHVPQSVDLSDPAKPPVDRLPVLFWIHGGAFFIGAGTYRSSDGRFLSNVTNCIVVTINYRLGPLGFLVYGEGDDAIFGNQGLQDQQMAMQWVQDNIENFGGDRNRVTIFGESAGAQSVMFHLLSDVSEPMFIRGIMQSNPAVYPYPNRDEALNVTDQLVRMLKLSLACGPLESDLECLYEASAADLLLGMYMMMARYATQLNMPNTIEPFRPYIDGEEFRKKPLELFKEGNWQTEKPIIIGTNIEELDILKFLNPSEQEIGESGFRTVNKLLLGNTTGDLVSDKYEELATDEGISDYGLLFGRMMTDLVFECPSRALARYASATADANSIYFFVFSHWLDGGRCNASSPYYDFCGYSYHGADVKFVFRVMEHLGYSTTEGDIAVSNQFSNYWGSFARTGSPSDGLEIPLPGDFPDWPHYMESPSMIKMNKIRETRRENRVLMNAKAEENAWPDMRLDEPASYIEYDFDQDICDFWDGLGVYSELPEQSSTSTILNPVTLPQTTHSTVPTTTMKPDKTTDGAGYISMSPFTFLLALGGHFITRG